jgi:hypothetical protein
LGTQDEWKAGYDKKCPVGNGKRKLVAMYPETYEHLMDAFILLKIEKEIADKKVESLTSLIQEMELQYAKSYPPIQPPRGT